MTRNLKIIKFWRTQFQFSCDMSLHMAKHNDRERVKVRKNSEADNQSSIVEENWQPYI